MITIKVKQPKIKLKVYNGIGASPFKEHIVNLTYDGAVTLNNNSDNYFEITWEKNLQSTVYTGTMDGPKVGLKIYKLKPVDNTEGDRVQIEYTDTEDFIVVTGAIVGFTGDESIINDLTLLIRYPA